MRTFNTPLGYVPLAVFLLGCSNHEGNNNKQTTKADPRIVGKWTWSGMDEKEIVNIYREFNFLPESGQLSTSCRSSVGNTVANSIGQGTWSLSNEVVTLKWVETQRVGDFSQQREYELTLHLVANDEGMRLVNPENEDFYEKE